MKPDKFMRLGLLKPYMDNNKYDPTVVIFTESLKQFDPYSTEISVDHMEHSYQIRPKRLRKTNKGFFYNQKDGRGSNAKRVYLSEDEIEYLLSEDPQFKYFFKE